MTKGKRASEKELADELYSKRHDRGEWSLKPVAVAVKPTRTEVISFRLPSEELDLLEVAAQRAGQSISDYVRGALALRRTFEAVIGVPNEAFGPVQVTFRTTQSQWQWELWNTARYSIVQSANTLSVVSP